MEKVFKIVGRISTALAWVGVGLIVAMAGIYIFDTFGRLLFNTQARGTFEIAQFFLCIITFGAYAYTQVKRRHIHVGFIIIHFRPIAKYLATMIEFILCTVICVIITYALWRMGGYSATSGKMSTILGMPYSPIYYLSAVLMAMFTVTIVIDIIRCVLALRGDQIARESLDKVYM